MHWLLNTIIHYRLCYCSKINLWRIQVWCFIIPFENNIICTYEHLWFMSQHALFLGAQETRWYAGTGARSVYGSSLHFFHMALHMRQCRELKFKEYLLTKFCYGTRLHFLFGAITCFIKFRIRSLALWWIWSTVKEVESKYKILSLYLQFCVAIVSTIASHISKVKWAKRSMNLHPNNRTLIIIAVILSPSQNEYYTSYFLERFLEETRQYYEHEANVVTQCHGLSAYLVTVQNRLQQEQDRIGSFSYKMEYTEVC